MTLVKFFHIKKVARAKLLKKNKYFRTGKRGFTLVETLVAITILIIAIVGPMSLAQQSIASSRLAKNQITAFYLAQESVEYIRNTRDSNLLGGNNWLHGLSPCNPGDCKIDVITDSVSNCGATCPKLKKSSDGMFGYTNSWTETDFRRKIKLVDSITNSDEVSVEVEILWGNDSKSFKIRESLFKL